MRADSLLIVSHTPHYLRDGSTVGWSPTVREIDYLAACFRNVRHVAPVHSGPVPENVAPYAASNVTVIAVRDVPASGLRRKLALLQYVPCYLRVLQRELRRADAVHIRSPSGLGFLALLMLAVRSTPRFRWIKYAGSWQRYPKEPLSYRIQRWWIRGALSRGEVTVNGNTAGARRTHSFVNPCFASAEMEAAREQAAHKEIEPPVRLLFAGHLVAAKGARLTIEVLRLLRSGGLDARLDIVGDGPEREQLEREVAAHDLGRWVVFAGWRTHTQMHEHYRIAHLLLLPSLTEGWPKVIGEAMAHGVVPITSAVGSIPEYLAQWGLGKTHAPHDARAFAESVVAYAQAPDVWKLESTTAVETAPVFSYERYVERIMAVLWPGHEQR